MDAFVDSFICLPFSHVLVISVKQLTGNAAKLELDEEVKDVLISKMMGDSDPHF